MILSGTLGTMFWIRSRRWFKSYKYPYRLLVRILIQLCIVGLISILSASIVSPPRYYGDISTYLPLSYPLMVHWGISNYLVWPPHHYYSITIFNFAFTGGGLGSESTIIRAEIFFNSMPVFLLLNIVFTGVLLLLSELWKFFFPRLTRRD